MKSLLNKNLSQFICCMLVMFVLAIPLFYMLTKNYYAEEMIEIVNHTNKNEVLSSSDLGEDIVEGMVLQFMLIFAVLSLSLLLVMRFLTRRLWRPFDDTLSKIEQFNLEHSDIPHFVKSNIKEFERLNRSIEKLMRKDKKLYNSQKEFIENASHELQTPIAIIQSKLDLLMQENLDRHQISLISDMYNICVRLSHLNKNLLLLAKIDNSQFSQIENVNLKIFIEKRISLYSNLNANGRIILDDASVDITLKANISLLESMLDNLVVNAIRHSPRDTDIIILTKDSSLSVSNKEEDGHPLDKDSIFERFNNKGDKNRGNGLGLSIVKAICDYHHWTIDYQFIDEKHCFTVTFKI